MSDRSKQSPKTKPFQSIDDYLELATSDTMLVVPVYSSERPLKNSAGLLDWRLYGFISRMIRNGRLNGQSGEHVLIPFHHHLGSRHVLCVGMGPRNYLTDERVATEVGSTASKKIKQLGFKKVKIVDDFFEKTSNDVGDKIRKKFESHFQGMETGWIS